MDFEPGMTSKNQFLRLSPEILHAQLSSNLGYHLNAQVQKIKKIGKLLRPRVSSSSDNAIMILGWEGHLGVWNLSTIEGSTEHPRGVEYQALY